MWKLFSRHWFLLFLAIFVVVGFRYHVALGSLAHSGELRGTIMVVVMLLMGWTLRPSRIAASVRYPLPSIIAILVNIVVVPLLAWPPLRWLSPELGGGLVVAALVPCTLASASVWTRAAGGDDAIAMLTTVVTNLLCFLVAPLGLWLLLDHRNETPLGGQMQGLLLQVVLPLVGGQVLRLFGTSAWADRHQKRLAAVCQCGILLMVLFGAVISAESMPAINWRGGGEILATGLIACAVHVVAVAIAYFAVGLLGGDRPQQIGAAISGGQKTLMVGLQLALSCGVSVLPMVMYHVGQLVIDTLLVRFWNDRPEKAAQSNESPARNP